VAEKLFGFPSWFFVRTKLDQKNFSQMGVNPKRITLSGNMKYDTLVLLSEADRKEKKKNMLGLARDEYCVIGGSTWGPEEELLLPIAHRLILAPRRFSRFSEVKTLLEKSGKSWSLWSEIKGKGRWDTEILMVDTLGDLKDLYGACDAAFVGGSLGTHGGQSPLEPAAAGIPVLFGPSMENFHEEAIDLLEEGGALQVKDGFQLKNALFELSRNHEKRKNMGESAQRAVRKKQGVTKMVVDSLMEKMGLTNG